MPPVKPAPPKPAASKACILNDGEHLLAACLVFKVMSPQERAETIKVNKLCFQRFGSNLVSGFCKFVKKCKVEKCKGFQHELLHGAPKVYTEVAMQSLVSASRSSVLLQVVSIIFYGKSKSLQMFATLDQGSTASLIDETVATES